MTKRFLVSAIATKERNMASSLSSSSNSNDEYIYHERQQAALCGQHALNNLVQASVFTAGTLAEIAHELDEMELIFMSENNEGGVLSKDYLRRVQEGSGNVDSAGNFSIQVLRAALERVYNLSLPSIGQDDLDKSRDITSYPGFICNRSDHWFAIRKIGPQFWNLNSLLEQPTPISHFRLAAELEALKAGGYSVFVITQSLPDADRTTGASEYWWRRADLERGKASSGMVSSSDWNRVGTGRRLDGKSSTDPTTGPNYDNMTEEEMLHHALQASILPDVPDEPHADAEGVVRIQFRLGDQGRQVRRFLKDQPVLAIYAYCEREMGGGAVELRFGFPPQDLSSYKQKTIGEAKLHGESIQARSL